MIQYKNRGNIMFFKRKKKEKVVIESKYQIGELVYFRYNGDLRFGKVSNIFFLFFLQ